jgi:hypothetical protein
LRGAIAFAAFPLAASCSIWLGATAVDRIQASATYFAPVPCPQIGTCPDCSPTSGSGGATLSPKINVTPSAKPPIFQSPRVALHD